MSGTRFPARFGKYILLDRINSGGMAEVYRAKVTGAEGFEQLVAVKCMLPELADDAQFTTMFVDEAKLAAQLSHPNIVQIHELGRIGQRLYIAMELVVGRDLRHVIRAAAQKRVELPLPFVAYVVAKVGEGLDFAHRKRGLDGRPLGLVHRDVSPHNILVSYDGEVKVVDFGIAKAEPRATRTQAGTLKGKFAYMAPEQVAGSDVDRRADVFALGAVLYEALSGRRLFAGDSDLSILDKVSRADTRPVEALLASGHEQLRDVFARALAGDREERYAWASELAEALAPFVIEDRTIFGARRAAQLMHSLYDEEIAALAERNREYASITAADVTGEPSAGEEHTRDAQVFGTDSGNAWLGPSDWVRPAGETTSTLLAPVGDGQPLAQSEPPRARAAAGPLLALASAGASDAALRGRWRKRSMALAAGVVVLLAAGLYATRGPLPPGAAEAGPRIATAAVGLAAGPAPASAGVVDRLDAGAARPAVAAEEGPTSAAGGLDQHARAPADAVDAAPGQAFTIPPTQASAAPSASTATVPPARVSSAPGARAPRSTGRRSAAVPSGFGFISVVAPGAAAQVFVDGEEAGYTPLVRLRVATGTRAVRVVELSPGNRERTERVVVEVSDTQEKPRKVIVRL